ncbi:related to polynucleotide adenylyltransferase [Phialocephala subalpina]|uniref:polynucleotide adenylyltransferase n=1 Tax=Phialocephala subalpina TaxID=576137 RepID=A0A1L7XCZ2_9HELO|nr:related to polynucleotide adenylyltransferase [Phialocephala subalpina]
MEGQSSAGNSQYQYQSAQWSRLVRRNTLADPVPISSPSIAVPAQRPSQLDLIPILLPQHSSYHQLQLAQYNRLISTGRTTRLVSSPLPPLLSAQHIQAVPGPRSGSTTSSATATTARNNKTSSRVGHGNKESRKPSKGERALITEKETAAKMPAKKLELSNPLPSRPLPQHQTSTISQQSNSVPSTPHQHARKFSFESRPPSPNATNGHSPRSAYSESNIILPSSRPIPGPRGGCRYETAMAHTKRRMPYSLGGERLEKKNLKEIKSKLSEDEERKLSTDMRELYDRLLPSSESDGKREALVQKLENLFNTEWPGHNIKVHMFGSSGNMLCTDTSDVDICITTDWKAMEGVCIIADLLARNGMEKVICVSTAKVPIVKIWDPELRLACDMNVNNTAALENTRMIKTYVQIDPRVRPLAMIIKNWTKERIVNDAAFGGTLSSYTWICMIIYFLQTRNIPILPALHQRPHLKLPAKDGVQSAFADDLKALSGFGKKNKESLGELLFHFFRFYGHEFDYDKLVISVRNGKAITKVEKQWQNANNNRLCVEEPFNVNRNLGNTADDTSFRGLHMEIRRAFDLLCEGKLEECCETYKFPEEQERVWERPPPKPKPVLRSTSQSSSRGRGGGHRNGGRHNNNHSRNGNSNRRASSGAFDAPPQYMPGVPLNMSTQEAWLQQRAQAQLHNDLYTTYSVLQAQENSLRLQLYAQGLQQSQAFAQSQAQAQAQSNGGSIKQQQATDRNRTNSFDQPPLSAPIRPEHFYFYPLQYQAASMYGYQTSPSTGPSSPSLSSAVPELRRSMHRSSMTNGSGSSVNQPNGSTRSHSQPATRSGPSPLGMQGGQIAHPGLGIYQAVRHVSGVPINFTLADENLEAGYEPSVSSAVTPPEENTPKEYVGYYVSDHTQSPIRRQSAVPMPIPAFGDATRSHRRLSTDQLPQSILDRLKRPSRSPSPLGHDRSYSTGAHSAPITAVPSQQGISHTNLRAFNHHGPMVVNGSNPVPVSIPHWQASVSEGSIPEDRGSDALSGSLDSISQASGTGSDASGEQDMSGQLTPRDVRPEGRVDQPLVVNGSSSVKSENGSPRSNLSNSNGVVPQPITVSNGYLPPEQMNGPPRLSPNTRNRLARQNGGMSPLDIGTGHNDLLREDLPHLSPVYETRTPSPTTSRKFEPLERRANGLGFKNVEGQLGALDTTHKPIPTNGTLQGSPVSKLNGHTRASKSEGASGAWQKIQKGKKKGPAESRNNGDVPAQGEKLPAQESERKGG